ncbi:30S ribosomal protein S8 [Candidatus Collierbacteria bacterium RIFOXYD1_FULL_40_9]|uniref:Small ribosomal subunit protein uS8 n=1 Tax=Candidatus Collierbacteria bacterium RIFOXYD1_FULL_40_9 TaxID=1817731 RepID=A0A1F5FWJ1_9BACT|nr:ribosomal protein S8 [uncultured bacterium]OGD83962.1 MAG: 30S ribosomal protein S8 [Candidatus Collierbacteria bacterium RIFOXYD1_FULL_40_9]
MDTTADFLTIIRNGYLAKKDSVTTNYSKFRGEVARVLKEEGFIEDYNVVDGTPSKKITVALRYFEKNLPAITGIKKVTKPSVRIYSTHNQIPKTLSGAGTTIVSTSQGLLTGKQAKEKHLGGEVICQIW